MLCKLAIRNMRKSLQDYAIYFLTLVLGVAIFYIFNSLESQRVMLKVLAMQNQYVMVLCRLLSSVSAFVAVVLGFLIVYANHFLIRRRKKEFGMYRLLGMGKGQVSRMLVLETLAVGCLSLLVGLVLGVFVSQLISLLVGGFFGTNLTKFVFVFSAATCGKTCLYFAIMYLAVLLCNTGTITRYTLLSLLTSARKNERIQLKNPAFCIGLFVLSAAILGMAYYQVMPQNMFSGLPLSVILSMGVIGTVGVFWSLSGCLLWMAQSAKKTYFRGTNLFVVKQLYSKINTVVASMSIISLLLFLTITLLSSGLSLRSLAGGDTDPLTQTKITMILFVAIYLGVIFLLASALVLALQQLTESADNRQQYEILRKIGCDEKWCNHALLKQIGVFFALPLLMAAIHSIFGLIFLLTILSGTVAIGDILPSTLAGAGLIGVIYGMYFLATYFGSKRMIRQG